MKITYSTVKNIPLVHITDRLEMSLGSDPKRIQFIRLTLKDGNNTRNVAVNVKFTKVPKEIKSEMGPELLSKIKKVFAKHVVMDLIPRAKQTEIISELEVM